jgi:O-antigen ligase
LEDYLRKLGAAAAELRAIRDWWRREYDITHAQIAEILDRRHEIGPLLEKYLLYSTIASLFMGEMLFHKGVDVFAGYPIVVANTVILLVLNRLLIHRNHAIFVGIVMLVSVVAARHSGTPVFSIVAQIIGILVFSIYYFSMLTTYGLSVPRWIEIYARAALLIAIWGIIDFVARTLHIFPQTGQTRLHSILPEPSFFVYLTLPAIGIYLNAHLRQGGYRMELAIFLFTYVLADSSLGYLGLLLAGFFAFLPRLNFWRLFGFAILAASGLVGLFFGSANFRLRVIDTALGIARNDLQHVNASTFAVLANAFVAIRTFLAHPFIGVGIGGYLYQYMQYMPNLSNDDPNVVTLNMYDAASLFFRTAAELGLFGLIFLFGFLIVCSRVKGDVHVDIRNALVPFFLMRMGRYGAYFSLDLYFFVGLYFLNYMHYRAQIRPRRYRLEPAHAV